jgi:hypothetical protein
MTEQSKEAKEEMLRALVTESPIIQEANRRLAESACQLYSEIKFPPATPDMGWENVRPRLIPITDERLREVAKEILDTCTSVHYRRVCEACGYEWAGLHCIHDGYQNPCGNCGKYPQPVLSDDPEDCEFDENRWDADSAIAILRKLIDE